jgi:hypothetical protein
MKKILLTALTLATLSFPSISFADLAPEPDIFPDSQTGDHWLVKGLIILSIVIILFIVKTCCKKRK